MTQSNKLTTPPIHPVSVGKRMVVGAGIGLVLISIFLLGVREPNPAWGTLWMIRPLLIVPLAGAVGGLCNYVILHFHNQIGVNKSIAVIVSVLVGSIGLWLGIVLGLAGTLWH
ncbi:potassium transporter KefB [Spirosoma sp. KCTC 42546]|uniref:potassium transporter KefB n=1 Tax=Spirosoma sp. KCTC 42546 TaxID=2520506 RepID=UPI0011581DF4|nr:potassium transporter KefB [Spirosoma sp. KCTC 42546]QDK77426.1 potassium transporter KefB [Spirosoma sp. KCTC 42546]